MSKSPAVPDSAGRFGRYGGRYVPELLMSPLDELARAYAAARKDPSFRRRLGDLLRDYVGRPTPLYCAERLSDRLGGAPASGSRGRICCTPVPTRSTTPWVSRCSLSAWARRG